VNIIEALESPALFAPHFAGESWEPWKACLAALFGLKMTEAQAALYRECTGCIALPTKPFREGALVVGRRGGKSRALALIATFLGAFVDHAPFLAVGEVATIVIITPSKQQARTCLRYIIGLLRATPALAAMIEGETADSVTLSNRCQIEVGTASYKVSRGYTYVAVLADESAFWPKEESAQPDTEILRAVRPGLMTLPYSMLILASSPYDKRGELWRMFKKYFGQDSKRVLVWRAATTTMNPGVDREQIDAEREADPESAAAEYDACFREGLSQFIPKELVEAAVERGLFEIPPSPMTSYFGFCDPSGGSSDSMTLAISSRSKEGVAVLDHITEVKAPFDPDSVTQQFAQTLKAYGLHSVTGDRYGGLWPSERFKTHGIEYIPSERTKSQIYLETLPLLTARRVQLLDNRRLVAQLCGLERHTGRVGKDTIDHAPGSMDDVANAACGALNLAGNQEDDLAVWIRAGRSDPAPAPVALVPEPIAPDQLYIPMVKPGSADDLRMRQRRASRMVHTLIAGEPTVRVSSPKDIFLIEVHGLPAICIPEGPNVEVPLRIAQNPALARNGARIIDEEDAA